MRLERKRGIIHRKNMLYLLVHTPLGSQLPAGTQAHISIRIILTQADWQRGHTEVGTQVLGKIKMGKLVKAKALASGSMPYLQSHTKWYSGKNSYNR